MDNFEEIDWKDPRFNYVHSYCEAFSLYTIGTEGESSCCSDIFIRRYNQKLIKYPFSKKDYYDDADIQETIAAFALDAEKLDALNIPDICSEYGGKFYPENLDAEKFWYLLLFLYDYSKGECLGNTGEDFGCEQLLNLKNSIRENVKPISNNTDYYLPIDLNTKLSLTLTAKNGRKMRTLSKLENSTAIAAIAELIESHKEELIEKYGLHCLISKVSWDVEEPGYPITLMAATFTDYMKKFLKLCKADRKKCNSIDVNLFIGRLVFFTEISSDTKLKTKIYSKKNFKQQNALNNLVKKRKDIHTRTNPYYF